MNPSLLPPLYRLRRTSLLSMMKSEDYPEGYFERAEGSNYRNYGDDPGWVGVLNAVMDYFDKGARFIEMAAAKGYFILRARQRGFDAWGFDISDYAVSTAPARVRPYMRVLNAAEQWPYAVGEADAVFGVEFMEHVPGEEVDDVLMQAWSALKPGARLILKNGIVVPDDHPHAGQEDHDKTHVNMQPREWWEKVLYASGFEQDDTDIAIQAALDDEFKNRDWFGRWFVWHKVTAEVVDGE